jgi:8-oxo-dGTP pyrophosphatase MutT (NUDIX family)
VKEIIYNNDNISENEINRIVRRAKVIIVNSEGKILLARSSNNYYLVGGHADSDESDFDCLEREIKEEMGVKIKMEPMQPFLRIKYLNKDYPKEGMNTMSVGNYYILHSDIKPNNKKRKLTKEEASGDFHIECFSIDKLLPTLFESLDSSTRHGAVLDTIEAIKEYINISN